MTQMPSNASCSTAAITSEHKCLFNREKINLESYQLVWLDINVSNYNEDIRVTLESLRKIVDYAKLFDHIEECRQFLEQTKDTTTFLVYFGPLCQAFIRKIDHLKNICSIYIYCQNQEHHQQWSEKNSKIKHVYTSLKCLLNDLTDHVKNYKRHEESVEIFREPSQQDKTTDHGLRLWWIDFINVLICLPYPDDFYFQLINSLKYYYSGNLVQTRLLEEFENTYKSEEAIQWYTKDSFIYRLLNKALRTRNLSILFLFGFFIRDLCQQLKSEYEKFKLNYSEGSSIRVYRGQLMSRKEIEELQQCDTYIINNSFFSTTQDRDVAIVFLNSMVQPDDELQNILFEIEIEFYRLALYFTESSMSDEEKRRKTFPFADISHFSQFFSEAEILFMIGTKFNITNKKFRYDEHEKFWLVKLELDDDNFMKDGKDLPSINKRRTLKNCVNTFANDSFRFSLSIDDINIIFDRLFEIFTEEKWILAVKFYCQAEYQRLTSNDDSTLAKYDQALQIWCQHLIDKELNAYTDIGQIYEKYGDYKTRNRKDHNIAQRYYDLAITFYQLAVEHTSTDYETTSIYHRLSSVYSLKMEISDRSEEKIGNCVMAIKHKDLSIQSMLKNYPLNGMQISYNIQKLIELTKELLKCKRGLQQIDINSHFVLKILNNILDTFIQNDPKYLQHAQYILIRHEYASIYFATKSTDDDNLLHQKKEKMADSHITVANLYHRLAKYELAYENFLLAKEFYQEINNEQKTAEIQQRIQNLPTLIPRRSNNNLFSYVKRKNKVAKRSHSS